MSSQTDQFEVDFDRGIRLPPRGGLQKESFLLNGVTERPALFLRSFENLQKTNPGPNEASQHLGVMVGPCIRSTPTQNTPGRQPDAAQGYLRPYEYALCSLSQLGEPG